MKPEEYIFAVEEAAKKEANKCWVNNWRKHLADLETPFGSQRYPDRCEDKECGHCVPCVRCGMKWRPDTQPRSIHGYMGDYDAMPEVYIAYCLTIPWYNHKIIQYKPYMYDLLKEGVMLMSEQEILEGLQAIHKKWPRIVAWMRYETLYVAVIGRMRRVIPLLTEWMERRMSWFTPGSPFHSFTRTYTRLDSICGYGGICLDTPPLARDGPCNLPTYLDSQDWSDSTMNADHGMEKWVETECDEDLLNILSRAWASNAKQWGAIECESMNGMNGYKGPKRIVQCIAHVTGDNPFSIHDTYGGSTPFTKTSAIVMWHTKRTRCSQCEPLMKKEKWFLYCCSSLDEMIIEPIPTTGYECVLARAATIRRRRLRGVFWCAMKLLGKVRMLHFKPGVGMFYKEAELRFYDSLGYRQLPNLSKVETAC